MKRQGFFIYLSFRITFLSENVNQETSDSLPMWVVTTVVAVGKHSNWRSQMFYQINALKNLAIFPGKHLCWRFFLKNFIKKRLQHKCFPVNIAKCLSTAFYIEHFVPIHYTLYIHYTEFLCDDRIILILWVQNWYFSYFLCHSFVFLYNSSVRIGSPLLFRIYLVFIPKFLLSVTLTQNDGSFTILIDSLKFRDNSRKMWIWVFWILRYVIIFL